MDPVYNFTHSYVHVTRLKVTDLNVFYDDNDILNKMPAEYDMILSLKYRAILFCLCIELKKYDTVLNFL